MNAIQFVEDDPRASGSDGDGFLKVLYRLMHLRLSQLNVCSGLPHMTGQGTRVATYEITDREPKGPSKMGQMGAFGSSAGLSHIEW